MAFGLVFGDQEFERSLATLTAVPASRLQVTANLRMTAGSAGTVAKG